MSNILFKSDIADTLDYNRADMALSARQGRALKQMLTSIKKEMMLEAHPVGSLYWSMEATDPSKLFGGTWEQIKDRFVWAGTGNPGSTGGEATHTLTIEEMPSHNHTTNQWNSYVNNYGNTYNTSSGTGYWNNQAHITTDYTGGGKAHNNMPPYIVAYCWKRTA